MKPEQAAALRKPFPREAIGRMPKGGVMLDYVGHAAVTDRLLAVDATWTWEPVAYTAAGLPALDEFGGIWIRLSLCGVTRLGYGDAGGKKGPNAVKEAIGDALRNAAMRFGVGLDLWAKEELPGGHVEPVQIKTKAKTTKPDEVDAVAADISASAASVYDYDIAAAQDLTDLEVIGARIKADKTLTDLDKKRLRNAYAQRKAALTEAVQA
jgi:hypothetical protein